MKTQIKSLAIVGFLALAMSCSKKSDVATDPTKGFSAQVQNIVSQSIIDDLKTKGMPINEGTIPPKVEGIFISSPHTLVVPYGTDDGYKAGYVFDDLLIRFSSQKADGSITVETKNSGATANGVGGFLSGNGNKFSIFAELKYVDGSVTATQLRVFSGEITSTGIKDFYTTLYMKDKNDPNNTLIPVGKSRIIKDDNGLASTSSNFRVMENNNIKKELPSEMSSKK